MEYHKVIEGVTEIFRELRQAYRVSSVGIPSEEERWISAKESINKHAEAVRFVVGLVYTRR